MAPSAPPNTLTPHGRPPRYIVTVPNVQEVSLYGAADLAYWRARLRPEGLAPFDDQGCAELLLIAADMVWLGVRFSELSLSVTLAQPAAGHQRGGMFLAQAYNSRRAFAWVERQIFQTPYVHAHTRVAAVAPIAIELHAGAAPSLRAALATGAPVSQQRPAAFAGPVYLPRALTRTRQAEKYFIAHLSGDTAIYPFVPGRDTLTLAPASGTPAVQWLRESGFAGKEWHVRPAALHRKSETYRAAAGAAPRLAAE